MRLRWFAFVLAAVLLAAVPVAADPAQDAIQTILEKVTAIEQALAGGGYARVQFSGNLAEATVNGVTATVSSIASTVDGTMVGIRVENKGPGVVDIMASQAKLVAGGKQLEALADTLSLGNDKLQPGGSVGVVLVFGPLPAGTGEFTLHVPGFDDKFSPINLTVAGSLK